MRPSTLSTNIDSECEVQPIVTEEDLIYIADYSVDCNDNNCSDNVAREASIEDDSIDAPLMDDNNLQKQSPREPSSDDIMNNSALQTTKEIAAAIDDGAIIIDNDHIVNITEALQSTPRTPGAHHIPGPGRFQTSDRGGADTHENNNLNNNPERSNNINSSIDDELDRLGIHRVTAEAVPIDDDALCDDGGVRRLSSRLHQDVEEGIVVANNNSSGNNNNNSSSDEPSNQEHILIQAEPIKLINVCGHEVTKSSLKLILLVCGVTFAIVAIIAVPIVVTASSSSRNGIDQDKDNDQQPKTPEDLYLYKYASIKDCMAHEKDVTKCEQFRDKGNFKPPDLSAKVGTFISSEESFKNPNSPQYKAREWVLNADVNNPFVVQQTRWLQERYIMAVLYYSMGGEGWTRNSNLLELENHCDASSEEDMIVCDENSRIVSLNLGMLRFTLLRMVNQLSNRTSL